MRCPATDRTLERTVYACCVCVYACVRAFVVCLCVCARACVRAFVCMYVRARARVCVRACICVRGGRVFMA